MPAPRSQTRSRIAADPPGSRPDAPSRRRYWRARETSNRVRDAVRARRDRPNRHRRQRTWHAGCPCWCIPGRRAVRPLYRRAACPSAVRAGCRANPCAARPYRRRSGRPPTARRRAARLWFAACMQPAPLSWAISQATQRVPLPQAPASLPSGLKKRMKASAAAGVRSGGRLDHDQLVAADAGVAVGQSARGGRHRPRAVHGGRRARRNRCRARAFCGSRSCACHPLIWRAIRPCPTSRRRPSGRPVGRARRRGRRGPSRPAVARPVVAAECRDAAFAEGCAWTPPSRCALSRRHAPGPFATRRI